MGDLSSKKQWKEVFYIMSYERRKKDPETRFSSCDPPRDYVVSNERGRGGAMKYGHDQPQKIGIILEEVLSQKGYLTVCKEYTVTRKWAAIVDPSFAAVSKCEKIENGILYVKVKTASWRQEAVYLKDSIVTKIQKEFGCPTIKDIVFH